MRIQVDISTIDKVEKSKDGGNTCRTQSFAWLNETEKRPQLINWQRLQAKDHTYPQRTCLKSRTTYHAQHLQWTPFVLRPVTCAVDTACCKDYTAQLIARLVHIFSLM